MSKLVKNICRYCGETIDQEHIFQNTVMCTHCGGSYSIKKNFWQRFGPHLTTLFVFLVVLAGAYMAYNSSSPWDIMDPTKKLSEAEQVQKMNLEQARSFLKVCLKSNTLECRKLAYKRLLDFEPRNETYQANFAFTLTQLGEHREAIKIYQNLLDRGVGTYDIMAFYADSLQALGKTKKAILWYQNSLAIYPNLVDVTKKLSRLFVETKQPVRAASLLSSYMQEFPNAKGYLDGDLLTIRQRHLNQSFSNQSQKKIELFALSGSHFFLPIQVGGRAEMFMIDTGATTVVMNTKAFNTQFADKVLSRDRARFQQADGSIRTGFISKVSEIKVGPWKLKNVLVSHCDGCQNLAGQSLLKNFTVKTRPKGEIEVMELRKRL